MKIIDGACSLAITNNSLTILDPSPMYFCTNSDPCIWTQAIKRYEPKQRQRCLTDTRMKQQSVWWATARASRVFPVPGGPYSSTPFGCEIPRLSKISGCLIGSSITSFISFTWIQHYQHRKRSPHIFNHRPASQGPQVSHTLSLEPSLRASNSREDPLCWEGSVKTSKIKIAHFPEIRRITEKGPCAKHSYRCVEPLSNSALFLRYQSICQCQPRTCLQDSPAQEHNDNLKILQNFLQKVRSPLLIL